MDIVPERRCNRCEVVKPADQFKGKRSHSHCIECHKTWWRAYREANRQRIQAAKRQAYQDNSEASKQRSREWKRANYERYRLSVDAWVKANPEKVKAYKRAYKAGNPEKRLAATALYRAKKQSTAVERVRLEVLIERDNATCQICRKPKGAGKWSIDHIVPIAKGGQHSYLNTQLAHLRCNSGRRDRGPGQLRMLG